MNELVWLMLFLFGFVRIIICDLSWTIYYSMLCSILERLVYSLLIGLSWSRELAESLVYLFCS